MGLYEGISKPAFVFDGRNTFDPAKLNEIGFHVYATGRYYMIVSLFVFSNI